MGFPAGAGDEELSSALQRILPNELEQNPPDLVIYGKEGVVWKQRVAIATLRHWNSCIGRTPVKEFETARLTQKFRMKQQLEANPCGDLVT